MISWEDQYNQNSGLELKNEMCYCFVQRWILKSNFWLYVWIHSWNKITRHLLIILFPSSALPQCFHQNCNQAKLKKSCPIDLQLGSLSIPDGETTIPELTVKKNSASFVITHKWFPVTTAIKAWKEADLCSAKYKPGCQPLQSHAQQRESWAKLWYK